MTSKLTVTKEQIIALIAEHSYDSSLVDALEHLLAALDSEPLPDDELSNLLWYSQEATCHSDPNYYCEFRRLATPGFIAGIILELQERRKADSEPVAEVVSIYGDPEAFGEREIRPLVGIQQMPYETKLYRHAQPAPVVQMVPEEPPEHLLPKGNSRDVTYRRGAAIQAWKQCRAAMLQELQKSAGEAQNCRSSENVQELQDHQIRELVNQLRDIAIKYHAAGQLREQIARTLRAAMLQAGNSPVIPVSERMPEPNKFVLVSNGLWVGQGTYNESEHFDDDERWQDEHSEFINLLHHPVTHWQPLPPAPKQENI